MKFNAQMRPLAKSGAKTQFRQPMDPQPIYVTGHDNEEVWRNRDTLMPPKYPVGYTFTDDGTEYEVLRVRAERIQEISIADAEAEGITLDIAVDILTGKDYIPASILVGAFKLLWESIYPGSWGRNSWVWAYEFKVV